MNSYTSLNSFVCIQMTKILLSVVLHNQTLVEKPPELTVSQVIQLV